MKKTKIIYWIATGIFGAFMLSSAIPDFIMTDEAVDFITKLGYPKYIVPFLGAAKCLGIVAIVIPGFPRIKEWAYAGLFFDLVGATYSNICVDGLHLPMLFMLVPFTFGAVSYIYYHRLYSVKV